MQVRCPTGVGCRVSLGFCPLIHGGFLVECLNRHFVSGKTKNLIVSDLNRTFFEPVDVRTRRDSRAQLPMACVNEPPFNSDAVITGSHTTALLRNGPIRVENHRKWFATPFKQPFPE